MVNTVSTVGSTIRTIPIHAPVVARGCGACHSEATAPACQAGPCQDGPAPALQGPPDALRLVLTVLGASLGFDGTAAGAGTGRVLSLTVRPGDEVDLVLVGGGQCSVALADAAFQSLRSLMPDTDIYVRQGT